MDNQEKIDNRDKIIERVRALLAMGSDTSSPNEAAIALGRARKLMDKHQVTAIDIENAEEDDFGENAFTSDSNQNRTWVGILVVSIAKLNSCVVGVSPRYSRKERIKYVFKGFEEDSQLCNFMMAYLSDAVKVFYKEDQEKYGLKGASDKNSYFIGFSSGINARIEKIIKERELNKHVLSSSTALVVAKDAMVAERFGETPTSSARPAKKGRGSFLGKTAAEKAHLGAFMDNKMETHERLEADNSMFDELFEPLWAEIAASKKSLTDSGEYSLVQIPIDESGKEWLKDILLEEIAAAANSQDNQGSQRLVRIHGDNEHKDVIIDITSNGISIAESKEGNAA